MGKMIAKTIAGKEFVYSRNSAHAVAKSSAQKICDALNRTRYNLKDGEIWHVYDMGQYERDYTAAGYQKFAQRKGRLYSTTY